MLVVFAAELRTLRRLARTRLLVAVGIGTMLAAYAYYSYLHGSFSGWSLASGNSLPRLSAPYFNSYVLWFFMAALVFLAFDVRRRDERERMQDVLDSRPVSNTALLWGKLAATVLAVWLPTVAALALIQAAAAIGRMAGLWMFPVEPVSTITFALLDAVPALVLWCAIVFALALGLRNRFAAAVVALALLGLHMASFAFVPAYLLPAISLLHIHDNWASDLAPRFADAATFAHRASMLLIAAALVVWAAAAHRRQDDGGSGGRLLAGGLLAAVGAAGIGGVALGCVEDVRLRDAWLATHEGVGDAPLPKVEAVHGHVRIAPGDDLTVDLELRLAAPGDSALEELVFSLNPGLAIHELRVDGVDGAFSHEHGLLTVHLPRALAAAKRATLALKASGTPDMRFAYLDSAVDWRRTSARNVLLWLGTEAGLFESRYVALMPGLRWLPVPGPNLDRSFADFPTLDLTAEAPEGWLVAGAGRTATADGHARLQGVVPLPAFGLLAAPFAQRSMDVRGVTLELLLHPSHQHNADLFADADTVALLRTRLETILEETAALGLRYPYKTFSVVEVPAQLRAYAGGWRLDASTALAGVLPIKEHGFAYGNFAARLDPTRFPGPGDQLPALKVQALEILFVNPYIAENARRAFARNLLTYQTAASGRGAVALGYVAESLTAELLSDRRAPYFIPSGAITAHSQNIEAGFGTTLADMASGLANRLRSSEWSGFWQPQNPRASVWERAANAALGDLDFDSDAAGALAALSLRGDAVTKSIIDAAGRERMGALVGSLRRVHEGGSYDAEDFADAGGEKLRAVLGNWLDEAALPAFIASKPRIMRIAQGDAPLRFETRLHVRNTAPVPGLVRLGQSIYETRQQGEPVVIPAESTVEVALVTDAAPAQLWLIPYLAANRFPMRIELPPGVEDRPPDAPTLGAAVRSDWLPPPLLGIVVDDLDPGFAIDSRSGNDLRLGASATDPTADYDQGLPSFTRQPGEWSRASIPTAWGRYRRSVAGVVSGDGATAAVFTAELPAPGRWRLDYHIPERALPPPPGYQGPGGMSNFYGELGTFNLAVVAAEGMEAVDFDAADAAVGWNRVREFDLASTHVRVEVSGQTNANGQIVLADAVRWLPVDP